ncbi:hypothetical protein GCM10027596_12740 [Nocardioides korecus]
MKTVATGPVPVRTARGAGRPPRAAGLRAGVREPPLAGLLPELREEPFAGLLAVLRAGLLLGVPLLRDAGGEDVRVAMLGIYPDSTVRPVRHTPHHGHQTASVA